MKPGLARAQSVANVAGAALLWWLAAPLLAIGDRHPFDGTLARLAGLAVIVLVVVLGRIGVQQWRQRRNTRLFEQVQGGSAAASEALVDRFNTATQLLQAGVAGAGGKAPRWWRRGRQVYQLPWYVFIGAPGAGKTTALLHAGLRFPLAERLGAAPVAGIGGTRQCDWWFTDQAVFIDTAGRYTTQDSHAASDAQEWQLFLRLLRRFRPVQPINGVVVTVSVPDLLHGGAELERQAAAVDRRLHELRAELGLSFPVYLLVTKADLLAGFVEYFGDFNAVQREQVWGITFDTDGATTAGEALPPDLAARLAALPARIAAMLPRRLQEEPLLQRRAAIYHFAEQVEALLPALEAFARAAFRHASEAPRQIVRGIHFSSGTQEGNPIDRVLGELSRSYGLALRALPRPDDGGKAYFLASLLQGLVIAEAPLAGANLQRRQRRRWLAAGAGGVLASVLLLACAGWWFSYRSNLAYVEAVNERVQKVARQIEPAKGMQNIDQLLPLYTMLSQLAASGQIDPARPAWGFDFGLFQGPRLARSAEQTYHRVLDRTLAPLLAERLNRALREESDAGARYEALRISLMIATPAQLKRDEVRRWAAQAFATPVSAPASSASGQAPGAGEQQEWLRHLDALLERNAVQGAVQLDDAAVRSARTALAAIPLEQLVHERVLRRAREQLAGERTLADLAGAGAVIAFAPADSAAGVPGIASVYTRAAWRELIEPALEPTIAELADEGGWVMGDRSANVQRLRSERAAREALARQLAQRHAQATIVPWDRLLAALAVQVPADAESLARFGSTLAAANSPLRQLLARLVAELPPGAPAPGASGASLAYDAALNEHFGSLRDYARDAGSAAVDRLIAPLPTLLRDPASPGAAELGRELRAEAARAPRPLREIWSGLAEAIGAQQKRAIERQLGGGLNELAQTCRRLIGDRFPFVAEAKRDMPYADFARVFGPQGLLDAFFKSRLASQVDTRNRPWRLAAGTIASPKAQASLHSFEQADEIRRLFFPAGAELPQLRLRLTPVTMDSELLLFSVDVDGQLLRYENGPRRARPLTWPGPAATQRVLLRILPAGPTGVGAEVHEGPWALLRVLQRGGWQRVSGNTSVVKLEVDGRSLSLEVASEAPVGVASLGELPRFRCPEAW